jgi:energy-coupling factor transporter ATP-binding protein EcfA2
MSQQQPELTKVKFIRDTEAKEDSLTHKQTAAFLVEAIKSNRELRSIALIGPWGSGKSTVISFLQEIIDQENTEKRKNSLEKMGAYPKGLVSRKKLPPPSKTYTFKYDAWLHQSEVPRRSFIEAMLADLVPDNASPLPRWRDEIDRLTGRIEMTDTTEEPVISVGMAILFFSFILSSLGMTTLLRSKSLFEASKPWISSLNLLKFIDENFFIFISWMLIISPILVVLSIAIVNILSKPIKIVINSITKKQIFDTSKKSDLFSIFVTRKPSRIKKRVIKDPVPTTIEFQTLFRSISKAILQGKSFAKIGTRKIKRDRCARIVIIIDNLDRLPEEEAQAIWPVMRNLFLDQATPTANSAEPDPVVVIASLNIDALIKDSIEDEPDNEGTDDNKSESEQEGSDGDQKNEDKRPRKAKRTSFSKVNSTKALLEKSFDLLVSMPNPRLSSWHGYLETMLRKCLGNNVKEDEMSHIVRLVDNHIDRNNIDVTPRGINSIVNSIAVIWMRWRSNVSAESITAFAIDEYKIKANVMAYIKSSPKPFVSLFDPKWEPSLYAMAHGTPMEKAYEVMREEPIREAIEDGDLSSFSEFAKEDEFKTILSRIIGGFSDTASLSFSEVLNTVEMLDSFGEVADSYFNIWKEIQFAFSKSFPPKQAEEVHARQLPIYIEKLGANPAYVIRRYLDSSLTRAENTRVEEYRACLQLLKNCESMLSGNEYTGKIEVRGKGHIFLKLITDLKGSPNARNAIAFNNAYEARSALLNLLSHKVDDCGYEQAALALVNSHIDIGWDELLYKLHELIAVGDQPLRKAALHLTSILGSAKAENGEILEDFFVGSGCLMPILRKTIDNEDSNGVAACLAMLLRVPPKKWPFLDEDRAKWIKSNDVLGEKLGNFPMELEEYKKIPSRLLDAGTLHQWFLPLVPPAILSMFSMPRNDFLEKELEGLQIEWQKYSGSYPSLYFDKVEEALNQLKSARYDESPDNQEPSLVAQQGRQEEVQGNGEETQEYPSP